MQPANGIRRTHDGGGRVAGDARTSGLDLTQGSIVGSLVRFSLPLMAGNVLQQAYNVADTIIVGRFVGDWALAAVGSAYTLMVLLNSIILGLAMGSGAYLSIMFGRKDEGAFRQGNFISFVSIGVVAVGLNLLVWLGLEKVLAFMQIPEEVLGPMRVYTRVILTGVMAVFLYSYLANVLRAVGNSLVPLVFLAVSSVLNICLDLVFVVTFGLGIAGAALATVLCQWLSGVGIGLYALATQPLMRVRRRDARFDARAFRRIASLSVLTSLQQSIMNFGILLVQGRVNSFGPEVMAAFAAAVKVDTIAYSPVQDFGNALSTFVAQNHGAGRGNRIREGCMKSALAVLAFCAVISSAVFFLGGPLVAIFTSSPEIVRIGATYLRIEGAFYCLIGFLFMFYGYFRAMEMPVVSVVLTVISLGTRVALAYALSAVPAIGVTGIWWSIPIGWALADLAGLGFLRFARRGG